MTWYSYTAMVVLLVSCLLLPVTLRIDGKKNSLFLLGWTKMPLITRKERCLGIIDETNDADVTNGADSFLT